MKKELAPCGTPAAYQRHRRRGEEIDDACREAINAYNRAYAEAHPHITEVRRAGSIIRAEAIRRLIASDPEAFIHIRAHVQAEFRAGTWKP